MQSDFNIKIDLNLGVPVIQREWGITCGFSAKPILYGYGVGPCYAASFYHREFKVGAFAHIDDSTDLDSVNKIYEFFFQTYEIRREELEVHVVGGWKAHPESEKWGLALLKKLTDDKVQLISSNIFNKVMMGSIFDQFQVKQVYHKHAWAYVALDTRTGGYICSNLVQKISPKQIKDYARRARRISEIDGVSEYPLVNEEDERACWILKLSDALTEENVQSVLQK